MIGLDTNVIVRYVTHDDPAQTRSAIKLLDSLSKESPGFVSLIVLAELVWVLRSVYDFGKDEVTPVLEILLQSDSLVIENREVAWQAFLKFKSGVAGFSDYLIERSGGAAGCLHTVTFDQIAAKSSGMKLLR